MKEWVHWYIDEIKVQKDRFEKGKVQQKKKSETISRQKNQKIRVK